MRPRWLSASINTSGIRAHGRASPTGPGHVPAGAEHGVRPISRSSSPRSPDRRGLDERCPRGPRGPPARQRRYPEGSQLISGLRDQLLLGALPADEYDLGAVSPQRVGDRQRGHDVPCGPPAPITILGALTCVPAPAATGPPGARDVQQQPDGGEHDAQICRRVGDERQRHAGERREPEHDEDVEQSLAQDQCGEPGREQLRIPLRRPAARFAGRRRRSSRTGTRRRRSRALPAPPRSRRG